MGEVSKIGIKVNLTKKETHTQRGKESEMKREAESERENV